MNDDENEIENDDDLNKQVVFCANDKILLNLNVQIALTKFAQRVKKFI